MTAMEKDFEAEPESAAAVRRFVQAAIPEAPILDDVVLAASELAANVIRHAKTEFTVQLIDRTDVIRIEVSDGSSIIPAIEDLTESQRGLRLIEAISENWGFETTDTGKKVWAEFRNH